MIEYGVDAFLDDTEQIYESGSKEQRSALDIVHELLLLDDQANESKDLVETYTSKAILLALANSDKTAPYARIAGEELSSFEDIKSQQDMKRDQLKNALTEMGIPAYHANEALTDLSKAVEYIRAAEVGEDLTLEEE
jgi:hypothetical protein